MNLCRRVVGFRSILAALTAAVLMAAGTSSAANPTGTATADVFAPGSGEQFHTSDYDFEHALVGCFSYSVNAGAYTPTYVKISGAQPDDQWTAVWVMELHLLNQYGGNLGLLDSDDAGTSSAIINSEGWWWHEAHNNGELSDILWLTVGTYGDRTDCSFSASLNSMPSTQVSDSKSATHYCYVLN